MADATDTTQKRWLTINQATALLGISQRTLYRRIESSQYAIRRVNGRTHVLVDVPVAASSAMASAEVAAMTDEANGPMAEMADTAALADDPGAAMAARGDNAVAVLERLVEADRRRADEAEARVREYAAAAAMWQERARNLEAQVEQLLALPAHEEEPASARHWWQRWWRP